MRWIGHELVEAGELVLDTTCVVLCGGDLESSHFAGEGPTLVCSKCGGSTVLDWRLGCFDGLTCRRATLGHTRRKS